MPERYTATHVSASAAGCSGGLLLIRLLSRYRRLVLILLCNFASLHRRNLVSFSSECRSRL